MELKASVKVLQPKLVTQSHVLLAQNRQYQYGAFNPNETLLEYVTRTKTQLPVTELNVFVNGVPLFGDWRLYIPNHNDFIVIRPRALGGGGNKVLRAVALIAVAVLSVYTAGAIGGVYGALTAGAIQIGGSLFVNALLPPLKPQTQETKETSPTYSISNGQNRINAYGPMSLVMGTRKVVPYHASKPYITYDGDNQYLSQAFHFGLQSDLQLSNYKIGQTLITDYTDVVINENGIDGKLTLVDGNVDTLDGFIINKVDDWSTRTTSLDTEAISMDFAAQLFNISDTGDYSEQKVQLEAQYRKTGDANWLPIPTGDTLRANGYWSLGKLSVYTYTVESKESSFEQTAVRWVQYKFDENLDPNAHKNGDKEYITETEYYYDYQGRRQTRDITTEYQWQYKPYQNYTNWRGVAPNPFTSGNATGILELNGSDPQKPVRRTISLLVNKGQYDLRFRKITDDIQSNKEGNQTSIAQIRCIQSDTADYSGQKRVALRIKASSQLNGTINEFSALAKGVCPVRQADGTWITQNTSNPAWWFLWFARGKRDSNYNRLFGVGLYDSRIDINAIIEWAAWCDANKLSFNYVLDAQKNCADVLSIIARAGRASWTFQTSKLGVVYDQKNLPITTLITPANIVADTFSISYVNDKLADRIVVKYYDANNDYKDEEATYFVPGIAESSNPITFDFEGCTNGSMAIAEAKEIAEQQVYARKRYSWSMDYEGTIVQRGDVVQLTHDLTNWGLSGRIVELNDSILTLDQDLPVANNAWLSIRTPINRIVYARVSVVASNKVFFVNGVPDGLDFEQYNPVDYLWQLNTAQLAGKRLKIVSTSPNGNSIKFDAVDDYASDIPAPQAVARTKQVINPINVLSVVAKEDILDKGRVMVTFSWVITQTVASIIQLYINNAPQPSYIVEGTNTQVQAQNGDEITIEILPTKDGLLKRFNYLVVGTNLIIKPPLNFAATGKVMEIDLSWNNPKVKDLSGTQIWVSALGDDIRFAQHYATIPYPQENYSLTGLDVSQSFTFWARAIDKFGNLSQYTDKVTGRPDSNPTAIVNYLTNQITKTMLGQELVKELTDLTTSVSKEVQDRQDAILKEAKERGNDVQNLTNITKAQAQQITTITSAVGNNTAAIDTEKTARANADGVLSQRIDTVVAQYKQADSTLTASIQAEQTARANGDTANAQQITSLTTRVSNAESSVSTLAKSIASVDGRVQSSYTIKTQATKGGRTAIAGISIGAESDGNTKESSVILIADKFLIANPNNSELTSIVAINDNKVGIRGDVIIDGTVTTSKMLITGSNIVPNSDFATGDFTNWAKWDNPNNCYLMKKDTSLPAQFIAERTMPAPYSCRFVGYGDGKITYKVISCFAFGNFNTDGLKNGFSVRAGETYFLSVDTMSSGLSMNFGVAAFFYKSDGTTQAFSALEVNCTTTTGYWRPVKSSFIVPQDCVKCYFQVYANSFQSNQAFWVNWTNLRCSRKADADLIVEGGVEARHLKVDMLSAINSNLGVVNIQDPSSPNAWAYARTNQKWWRDGRDGFIAAANGGGGSFFNVKSGNSEIWMSSGNQVGNSVGLNLNNNFLFDGNVVTIRQLDVIDTLNIKGNSVTSMVSSYLGAGASPNINIYAAAECDVAVFAYMEGIRDAINRINRTIAVDGNVISSDGSEPNSTQGSDKVNRYTYSPSTPIGVARIGAGNHVVSVVNGSEGINLRYPRRVVILLRYR